MIIFCEGCPKIYGWMKGDCFLCVKKNHGLIKLNISSGNLSLIGHSLEEIRIKLLMHTLGT